MILNGIKWDLMCDLMGLFMEHGDLMTLNEAWILQLDVFFFFSGIPIDSCWLGYPQPTGWVELLMDINGY